MSGWRPRRQVARMKLKHKIIFFAITPLLVAFCVIAIVVWHQTVRLGMQQRESIETAYRSSKDAELRHYVDLAFHSIAHLYNAEHSDAASKAAAIKILAQLDYGDDGYFFVYDLQGNTIMHPRQPELRGQNLWNWENDDGTKTIQRLIARAHAGGGYERYLWKKPSSNTITPKLGYVIELPKWGWILGTGIYLDDVDAALAKLDEQIRIHNRETMLLIAAIAILSVVVIASLGLLLNISEQRVADAKLRELAKRVVLSQEEERARVSRELHDGVSQSLVSIKLQTEAAIIKLDGPVSQLAMARVAFERMVMQMNDLLGEIRHISHGLRPAILDDLGLASALQHLCDEWRQHCGFAIDFVSNAESTESFVEANTVLFRIAQESFNNVRRHAQANHVVVTLTAQADFLALTIHDNGIGFDTGLIDNHPKQGIGLRNMAERLDAVGGRLTITSSELGTIVQAHIPTISKATGHV